MFLKMKLWFAKLALKKFLGGWAVNLYKKLEGKKTTVGLIGTAIASALLVFGVIDQDAYGKVIAALTAWTAQSLAAKGQRYQELFQMAEDLKVGAEDIIKTGKKLKTEVQEELKKHGQFQPDS